MYSNPNIELKSNSVHRQLTSQPVRFDCCEYTPKNFVTCAGSKGQSAQEEAVGVSGDCDRSGRFQRAAVAWPCMEFTHMAYAPPRTEPLH